CVLGVALVKLLIERSRRRGVCPLSVTEVKSVDQQAIVMVVTYSSPLLFQSLDPFANTSILVFVAILFFLFRGASWMSVNPVAVMLGYRAYEAKVSSGATYIVYSNRVGMLAAGVVPAVRLTVDSWVED